MASVLTFLLFGLAKRGEGGGEEGETRSMPMITVTIKAVAAVAGNVIFGDKDNTTCI